MQANRLAEQILEAANGVETSQYREVAEALTERGDATEVLAFLLKSHYSKPAAAPASEQAKARADKTRKSKPAKTQAPKEDRSEAPLQNRVPMRIFTYLSVGIMD